MSNIFWTLIVSPLYNALIFLVDFLTADIGVAVVVLTAFVRFVLYPLSRNAIKTQLKLKKIQPQVEELKNKYKDDPQTMAKETLALYRENQIKPFSGILLLFIQLPIIFGLYYVFWNSGLPEINQNPLYSFIPVPSQIDTMFLGLFDMTSKSFILAIIAGVAQFFQAKILMDAQSNEPKQQGVMGDIMKSMQIQMKYVMPVIIIFISYSFGAIIALYFATSNVFSVFQEIYIRKKYKGEPSPANN